MNLSSPCLNSGVLLATVLFHGKKFDTSVLCCWLAPAGMGTGGTRLLNSEALKVLGFIGHYHVLRWCKWLTTTMLTLRTPGAAETQVRESTCRSL